MAERCLLAASKNRAGPEPISRHVGCADRVDARPQGVQPAGKNRMLDGVIRQAGAEQLRTSNDSVAGKPPQPRRTLSVLVAHRPHKGTTFGDSPPTARLRPAARGYMSSIVSAS